MPKGRKAEKPIYNYINIDTVHDDIITALDNALYSMGFNNMGIDNTIPNKPRTITHNQLNYCFRQVYENVFKPDKPLYNNQKSLINYDDIELLTVISQSFLDICMMFNKSLGLMSFSYMTGISPEALTAWNSPNGEKLNPERSRIIKYIKEGHKAQHIALLNDSPVGALAVANNDTETGLEWSQNQAITAAANAVYLIPSERLKRLNLTAAEGSEVPPLPMLTTSERERKGV